MTSVAKKPNPAKPKKPYPGFPLFWHASGRWCKKLRQRFHYFGNGTAEEAMDLYQHQRDDLHAGRTPRSKDDLTVLELHTLCNAFLAFKEGRVESGELRRSTFEEYKAVAATMVEHFGRRRLVSDTWPPSAP